MAVCPEAAHVARESGTRSAVRPALGGGKKSIHVVVAEKRIHVL